MYIVLPILCGGAEVSENSKNGIFQYLVGKEGRNVVTGETGVVKSVFTGLGKNPNAFGVMFKTDSGLKCCPIKHIQEIKMKKEKEQNG